MIKMPMKKDRHYMALADAKVRVAGLRERVEAAVKSQETAESLMLKEAP